MADVLFLLDALDQQEKEQQRGRPAKKSQRKTPKARPLPISLPDPVRQPPPPPDSSQNTPRTAGYAASTYSNHSTSDSRRISFVDHLPRPAARRLRIITRTDNLASGFPHDPKLGKYGVSPETWETFSNEIVEAAHVPRPRWAWHFHRKSVISRLRKDLQYDCELKRIVKRWNKTFKERHGFQVNLEVPDSKSGKPYGRVDTQMMSKEEKAEVQKEARRFRIVISPNQTSAASIYSRSSSLTRSVTGEGKDMALAAGLQDALERAKQGEQEAREQNSPGSSENTSADNLDGEVKDEGGGQSKTAADAATAEERSRTAAVRIPGAKINFV